MKNSALPEHAKEHWHSCSERRGEPIWPGELRAFENGASSRSARSRLRASSILCTARKEAGSSPHVGCYRVEMIGGKVFADRFDGLCEGLGARMSVRRTTLSQISRK